MYTVSQLTLGISAELPKVSWFILYIHVYCTYMNTAHTCIDTVHTCIDTVHTCIDTVHTCIDTVHTCILYIHVLFTCSFTSCTPSRPLPCHLLGHFLQSLQLTLFWRFRVAGQDIGAPSVADCRFGLVS